MKIKHKFLSLILASFFTVSLNIKTSAENFVGLCNAGSSCFVNAAIQQLYHLSLFRNAVMNANIDDPDNQKILSTLKSIFVKMSSCNKQGQSIDIGNEIKKFEVYNGNPDDAQSVITYLINRCDDEYKKKKLYFSSIFEIRHLDDIFCSNCDGIVSKVRQNYGGLLNLNPAETLDQMINNYKSKDDIRGYVCDKCQKKGTCYLFTDFKASGRIFMINLGRLKAGGSCEIEFGMDHSFGTVNKYRLNGVIIYTGGHYYSYVRNKENDCWYCLNDASVTNAGGFSSIKRICYGINNSQIGATSLYYERVA